MAVKTSTAMAPFLHQAQFLHLTLTRLFNIFSLQKQKKLHGKPRHSISGESVDSIGWLTSSCLFHQPLKKLEHCGISPQSRPRSHLRQVYFARYCLTFSKSLRAQKNRVDIAELLPQLSCLPNSPRNALREQQLAHSGYILLLCNGVKCDLPDAAGVGRRFKEQASIGLAHVQGHGRSVYACHRNHQEWLQSNRLPWTYLIVPIKLELWGLDSL